MKENGAKSDSYCSSSTTLTSTSSSSSNGLRQTQNAYTFRDHMSTICNCFDTMNICEQTVALCSLLKRINPFQSRFIVNILDYGQSNANNDEMLDMKLLEKDANDFVIVKELETDSNENIINRLLYYLPLMKPGNEQLKQHYLILINRVASYSLSTSNRIDETRQILCYSLIHPAINAEEKKALSFWCHQFESSFGYSANNGNNSYQHQQHQQQRPSHLVSATTHLLTSWRNNTQQQPMFNSTYGQQHQQRYTTEERNNKVRRSNSLTPICSTTGMTASIATVGSNSQPIWTNNNNFRPSTRSFLETGAGTSMDNVMTTTTTTTTVNSCQLDWDHQPDKLCDYSSAKYDDNNGTSRHQQQQQTRTDVVSMADESKCSFDEKGSGMKDVPVWLKSLRLHKYSPYFSKMSYEAMMDLNEEKLEKMNITKGARHKIVLNIEKLKLRQENLRHFEKSLSEEGISILNEVLKELKYILSTPIKSYSIRSQQQIHEESDDQKENIILYSSSPSSSCANPNCDCDTANQCVPEGDLPGQIVRMMGKVCATILMSSPIEEESMNTFISLINICLNQEYFNSVHKRRFYSWKIQLEKSRKHQCHRQLRGRKWNGNNCQQMTRNESRQTTSLPNHRQSHSFVPSNNVLTNQIDNNIPQYSILKRQDNSKSINNSQVIHSNLYRTQSAPVRQVLSSSGHFETGLEYDRLNNQTESLCLRVTEQALGSLDGGQTF